MSVRAFESVAGGSVGVDELEEEAVEAGVGGELGMEAGGDDGPLAHEHRFALVTGEHLDAGADGLDAGRPDEHAVERGVEAGDVEIGLEAGELTAEAVA